MDAWTEDKRERRTRRFLLKPKKKTRNRKVLSQNKSRRTRSNLHPGHSVWPSQIHFRSGEMVFMVFMVFMVYPPPLPLAPKQHKRRRKAMQTLFHNSRARVQHLTRHRDRAEVKPNGHANLPGCERSKCRRRPRSRAVRFVACSQGAPPQVFSLQWPLSS